MNEKETWTWEEVGEQAAAAILKLRQAWEEWCRVLDRALARAAGIDEEE